MMSLCSLGFAAPLPEISTQYLCLSYTVRPPIKNKTPIPDQFNKTRFALELLPLITSANTPVELYKVGVVAEKLQEASLHHHPPSAHAHDGHHSAVPSASVPARVLCYCWLFGSLSQAEQPDFLKELYVKAGPLDCVEVCTPGIGCNTNLISLNSSASHAGPALSRVLTGINFWHTQITSGHRLTSVHAHKDTRARICRGCTYVNVSQGY